MNITFSAQASSTIATDLLVFPILASASSKKKSTKQSSGASLIGQIRDIDRTLHGWIAERMKQEHFTAAVDQSIVVHAHHQLPSMRLAVLGLGATDKLTSEQLRRWAGRSIQLGKQLQARALVLDMSDIAQQCADQGISTTEIGQALVEGLQLANYRFVKYKSMPKEPNTYQAVERVTIVAPAGLLASLRVGASAGNHVATAVSYVRDLVNEPAVHLTPRRLVQQARVVARQPGIQVEIFNEAKIRTLKMGALLAVAAGSDQPPYFAHLSYKAPRKGKRKPTKIVICGKGITYDSGGLSIKPSNYMDTMKMDMAGAGVILGLFSIIKTLKLTNVDVHGVFAATENMPSGKAIRPGDVVHAYNGTSIEINNTDAEGRLILADALSWSLKQLKPDLMLDVATLTGAAIVALGQEVAAVMGNDDDVTEQFLAATRQVGEQVAPLPLVQEYKPLLDSQIADIQNAPPTSWAGSIIGGLFLEKFVGETKWMHLDIAGPAWVEKQMLSYAPLGASGFGVRSIAAWLVAVASNKRP